MKPLCFDRDGELVRPDDFVQLYGDLYQVQDVRDSFQGVPVIHAVIANVSDQDGLTTKTVGSSHPTLIVRDRQDFSLLDPYYE
jgi:hypothetical protein